MLGQRAQPQLVLVSPSLATINMAAKLETMLMSAPAERGRANDANLKTAVSDSRIIEL